MVFGYKLQLLNFYYIILCTRGCLGILVGRLKHLLSFANCLSQFASLLWPVRVLDRQHHESNMNSCTIQVISHGAHGADSPDIVNCQLMDFRCLAPFTLKPYKLLTHYKSQTTKTNCFCDVRCCAVFNKSMKLCSWQSIQYRSQLSFIATKAILVSNLCSLHCQN